MALEQYPYKNYRFKVEVDSVMVAGFSEVSGFDATIDVIEYREGDAVVNTPRKQPGLVKYSNITFKRGVIDDIDFYTWIEEAFSGNLTRKTIVEVYGAESLSYSCFQPLSTSPVFSISEISCSSASVTTSALQPSTTDLA